MRRLGVVAIGLLLAGLFAFAGAPPAWACSCTADSPNLAIERLAEQDERSLLFLGEQISEQEGNQLTLTFRVDHVYGGDYGDDEIQVRTGQSSSTCGAGSQAHVGLAVFSAWNGQGYWEIGSCAGPYSVESIDAVLNGLPDPPSQQPPQFLVAHRFGSSNVALLDAAGEVVGYGEGDGEVLAMDDCPGAQAVALLVGPDRTDFNPDVLEFSVEVRSVPELDVVSRTVTEAQQTRSGWRHELRGFECHVADGSLVTFLTSASTRNEETGRFELGEADMHVVDNAGARLVPVGVARSLSVDPLAGAAFTINGFDGRTLTTWDLDTGEERSRVELPGEHVGWHIEVIDAGLRILGRAAPLEPSARSFPRINRLLSGPVDNLLSQPLGTAGALDAVSPNGNGVVVVLRNPSALLFIDAGGGISINPMDLPVARSVAVGSELVLLDTDLIAGLGKLESTAGPISPLDGIERATLVARIGGDFVPGLPISDQAPPVEQENDAGDGRAEPPTAPEAPNPEPTFALRDAEPSAVAQPTQQLPTGESSGDATTTVAIAAVVAALAAAALVLVWRNRDSLR